METTCWLIGRKTTLATNGHTYITEPFIVFETEDEARSACDMVEKVSGERPMMTVASRYRSRTIASEAAKARWSKPVADA